MDDSVKEHLDAVVDYLLRDRDMLVAREIRQKVEELNQLLVAANNRQMRVEFSSSETASPAQSAGATPLTRIDVSVYKRID
jgi:hypothetical protein